jgi:hypothetical protein
MLRRWQATGCYLVLFLVAEALLLGWHAWV